MFVENEMNITKTYFKNSNHNILWVFVFLKCILILLYMLRSLSPTVSIVYLFLLPAMILV